MRLSTIVDIAHASSEIDYTDRILLLGSCFAENMAEKLRESYFRVWSNPFGVLYNPLSLAKCIETLGAGELPEQARVCYSGMWHSMLHHGRFSNSDKEGFETGIAKSIEEGRKALEEATVVIVTFGTAWVYEREGRVVGNCHKLPSSEFTRRLLGVEEVVAAWRKAESSPLLAGKRVILTVSPIRHLKDGLHGNQLSKSILLLACEQMGNDYFPSYEILTDELRDYRFYADDLVHPSAMAIQYVWERFAETYFSARTREDVAHLHELYLAKQHRPLHPETLSYQDFVTRMEEKTRVLRQKYPWI